MRVGLRPDFTSGEATKKFLQQKASSRFFIHHIKGSHHYLKHPDKPELRVTVRISSAAIRVNYRRGGSFG
jgi:predicted RNA binding protein YcfA (HicA-like mRNA interferase family)